MVLGVGMAAAAALAPATASAAGLIAAYEQFVPGQGFQIGLKNAATGANIALPAGVNTAADELHPALSFDGRRLAFVRMSLLPSLNGDIPVPSSRTLVVVDRQTGAMTTRGPGIFAGPVFTRAFSSTGTLQRHTLSNGRGPESGNPTIVSEHQPLNPDGTTGSASLINNRSTVTRTSGETLVTTHGAVDGGPLAIGGVDRLMLTLASFNQTTGALTKSVVHLARSQRQSPDPPSIQFREFGSAAQPAAHPMPRARDNTVALEVGTQGAGLNPLNFDIHTTSLPIVNFSVPDLTPAPPAINTSAPEHMPAWSPDDLKLGFVRITAARRTLAVFDATLGIQAVVNSPLDLGPDAPTTQLRAFQFAWGGLSLAEDPDAAPTTTCTTNCLLSLSNSNLTSTVLSPTLTSPSTIGIFVARVTGTRRLLGRRVPRLRPVGRVPLGRARRGRNRFRWNGKVAGKRLRPGTYLLTFRTLRGKRVTNTSNSVRFTVTKSGKIRRVRRQR